MSINSCLEIDLTGQVCADSIGTRIFSSVGGQHDFVYGSSQSEGGLSFLAMLATTNKGQNKDQTGSHSRCRCGYDTFPNQLRRNRIRMRQPPGTKPRGTRQADDFRGRAGIPRRAGTRRSRTLRLLVPQTPIMTKCIWQGLLLNPQSLPYAHPIRKKRPTSEFTSLHRLMTE